MYGARAALTEDEIAAKARVIIADNLEVPLDSIEYDTRFTEDLGAD